MAVAQENLVSSMQVAGTLASKKPRTGLHENMATSVLAVHMHDKKMIPAQQSIRTPPAKKIRR